MNSENQTQDIYYQKYLKYKAKYLDLKKQVGGEIWNFNTTAEMDASMKVSSGNWRNTGESSATYDLVYRHNTIANLHCSRHRGTDRWHCSNNPPASAFQQQQNAVLAGVEQRASNWQNFQKSQPGRRY